MVYESLTRRQGTGLHRPGPYGYCFDTGLQTVGDYSRKAGIEVIVDQEYLASLLEEEAGLRIPRFSNTLAVELGIFMARRALSEKLAIAISIDAVGQRLFHCAMEGTSVDNETWLSGKTRVVYHFRHSSLYVSRLIQSKGRTLADYSLDPVAYRASGGAFPLVLPSGCLVGVVGASGLPDYEDHAFVTRALHDFGWPSGLA